MQPIDPTGFCARHGDELRLTQDGASHFAGLGLDGLQREYPNKLNQTLESEEFLRTPESLHPAFFGCYDWHSSVNTHWMLARLLGVFPNLPQQDQIHSALGQSITADNIAEEVIYFDHESDSWERPYGWAWLLRLAAELESHGGTFGSSLADPLRPLTFLIRDKFMHFLPLQDYPIRHGVHGNTAFALSFALDYARTVGDTEFENLVRTTALRYFCNDQDSPLSWEPGGDDFLSPSLEEAALMSRILDKDEFPAWFDAFLPGFRTSGELTPVSVRDPSDARIVHLHGLNFSRAWNLRFIAAHFNDPADRSRLHDLAAQHIHASMPHMTNMHYVGSHWLGAFVVNALTAVN